LGWDTANPCDVQSEISTEEGVPDYALIKNKKKVLYIEAKNLSIDNITNIEKLIKKLQILDEIWHSLLDEPKDIVKGFIPVFDDMIKEVYPDYEFDITEIEDFIIERVNELISPEEEDIIGSHIITEHREWRGNQQRIMKIGNYTYKIRNSYDILVNTAEWLIREGKLKKEHCPIASGHKRNLINIQPKHRYENAFIAEKKLSNGLYIETNHSNASCIKNARKILERFGYSGDILEIQ